MRADPPLPGSDVPAGQRPATPAAEPNASAASFDELFQLAYRELRRVAHRKLAAERAGHTLSTTALVHETYLKLAGQRQVRWRDRSQFFALAARAMRRILVDYARRHRRRRPPSRPDSILPDDTGGAPDAGVEIDVVARADELLELDAALGALAEIDERMSRVVEYRFFGGLTEAETAEVLGVTSRTVTRDWDKARGWLYQRLRPPESSE